MITDPTELHIQRSITVAFIEANHSVITLIPRVETKTTTGGTTWQDGTPREPQKFHIIERVSIARTNTRVPGGEAREEEFTLLGYWDAQMAVKDRFTHNGYEWQIQGMDFENGYERRGAVVRYGA